MVNEKKINDIPNNVNQVKIEIKYYCYYIIYHHLLFYLTFLSEFISKPLYLHYIFHFLGLGLAFVRVRKEMFLLYMLFFKILVQSRLEEMKNILKNYLWYIGKLFTLRIIS